MTAQQINRLCERFDGRFKPSGAQVLLDRQRNSVSLPLTARRLPVCSLLPAGLTVVPCSPLDLGYLTCSSLSVGTF